MTTGAIVVAWNGERYLTDCIGSLIAQTIPPREIVVIDNGSDDRSVGIVNACKSEADRQSIALQIVSNPRNLGFTRGANAGLRTLLSSPSPVDCVVTLNQDASLDSGWCEAVQQRLESDGTIGIVGSKIFHPNRLTIQHAGGYLERPRLVGRHFGHHRPDDQPLLHAEREVEFVTAAAMAIRLSALERTGCFQEVFSPGYYEDVDLCDRFHEAGWKILFCPEAIAVHAESASIKDRVRRLILSHRARLIYALRWLADDRFRDEFSRAERQHINGDLSVDERRALTAAYLELLLMLPRALNARVGRDRVTPAVTSALFEMLVELRDLLLAKKWTVSSLH